MESVFAATNAPPELVVKLTVYVAGPPAIVEEAETAPAVTEFPLANAGAMSTLAKATRAAPTTTVIRRVLRLSRLMPAEWRWPLPPRRRTVAAAPTPTTQMRVEIPIHGTQVIKAPSGDVGCIGAWTSHQRRFRTVRTEPPSSMHKGAPTPAHIPRPRSGTTTGPDTYGTSAIIR